MFQRGLVGSGVLIVRFGQRCGRRWANRAVLDNSMDETGPSSGVREVGDPFPVRGLGCEVAVEQVRSPCGVLAALDCGAVPFTSDGTGHSSSRA